MCLWSITNYNLVDKGPWSGTDTGGGWPPPDFLRFFVAYTSEDTPLPVRRGKLPSPGRGDSSEVEIAPPGRESFRRWKFLPSRSWVSLEVEIAPPRSWVSSKIKNCLVFSPPVYQRFLYPPLAEIVKGPDNNGDNILGCGTRVWSAPPHKKYYTGNR